MAEQVQSGPQQSRARRFLGAGKRTLDGEDRSERIKTGRKGTPFRAFSPTIKPEFPKRKAQPAVNESPFVAQSNCCGLTVNRVRFLLLAGAAFFATSLVAAQEVGW